MSKEKEIMLLREKLKSVGDGEFEVRGLRKELADREQEIRCVREDMGRLQADNARVYKV